MTRTDKDTYRTLLRMVRESRTEDERAEARYLLHQAMALRQGQPTAA